MNVTIRWMIQLKDSPSADSSWFRIFAFDFPFWRRILKEPKVWSLLEITDCLKLNFWLFEQSANWYLEEKVVYPLIKTHAHDDDDENVWCGRCGKISTLRKQKMNRKVIISIYHGVNGKSMSYNRYWYSIQFDAVVKLRHTICGYFQRSMAMFNSTQFFLFFLHICNGRHLKWYELENERKKERSNQT